MTKIRIPFGKTFLSLNLKDFDLISPKKIYRKDREQEIVKKSLSHPIGTERLSNMVKQGQKVVIIPSDITRPCPSFKIIPFIIKELKKSEVDDNNISFVFALGTHRKQRKEEWIRLIGNYAKLYRTLDHDCFNSSFTDFGFTSRGTPVQINELVSEADLRIGIANIDAHYFAGYSGGAKSLVPGCASYETIKQNHKLMMQPKAELGICEGNPVREDLEEAAKLCGLEFIVNVILGKNKRIVGCVSGHYVKAHREGVKLFNEVYAVDFKKNYDVVIASPGGYPKDLNLYQAQKALDSASIVVKEGGVIIWVAECKEGIGHKRTKGLLFSGKKPDEIIDYLKENFEIGYHKAYAIARVAKKANLIMVSKLPETLFDKGFIHFEKDLGSALKLAFDLTGSSPSIAVLPYAGSLLPKRRTE